MTKQYTSVLALLMVLLAFASVVLTSCKNAEEPPATTEPEVTTTDAYIEETEPAIQETEAPRTPGVYFVTVLPTANGSVTANCSEAKEGDPITLTVTPDEGYELISLTVNGCHSENTFTMPAEDVFVVARFGYPEDVDWKEYPSGDFFGSAGNCHSSDVLDMSTDSGVSPLLLMDAGKATPLYAYVKNMTANQFYLEMTAQVISIRSDESYPKFGLMIMGGNEMVKFYLDMTTDRQVGAVGTVRQVNGGADDWAGQRVWNLKQKLDLSSAAVKLGLLRDADRYYFYVNGQLVATDSNLSSMPTAAGIFSFGTSLRLTNYKIVQSGTSLSTIIAQAQSDAAAFNAVALTENFFTKTAPGVYTLTTDSDAQHKVDDVTVAGQVMREPYYRVSGRLTLTDAEQWGQARILVSADPQNEYFLALEKLGDGNYQIFTMSKANEEGWNHWELIASGAENGSCNSIDFEVVVIGDQLYFLIDNEIYYTSDRVSMTESTVKFTGYNVATTTVEKLSAEVFENQAAAQNYLANKEFHEDAPEDETQPVITPEGSFFGTAGAHTSSDALDMGTDQGKTPYLVMDADKATPLYAYVKDLSQKQFYLEMTVQVTGIRADEGYPKFGFMTHDGADMVKFYLDMNTEKQVGTIGAVHQLSGGEDDWAGQKTWPLSGNLNLAEKTVKLSLLRDGKHYYFYVNGKLEAVGSDLSSKAAATGVFSFGTSLKLTDYSVIKTQKELKDLLAQAQKDVEALSAINLSTNYFAEAAAGVYTLTTDSDAQHKVDDVRIGKTVMRAKYYSLKGSLSLTDAEQWGQARILISADPQNEYFLALEKTDEDSYQIFTMSKANEESWNDWRLIESAAINGSRSSIDFEVIVNGDHVYFLVADEICYTSSRVAMEESTVKFTGYNVGTTTVQGLSAQVFRDAATVEAYVAGKTAKAYESQYQDRMDRLYAEYITENNCAGKGGTLLLGSSTIDFWGDWENQTGLTKYVNGYNIGIGGTTVSDWLHGYEQLVKPFAADRFVIYVGGNDITVWGDSGEETVAELKTLFAMIHADFPDAEIIYLYTFPTPGSFRDGNFLNNKYEALIRGAKDLCDSLDYVQGIDTSHLLLTQDGQNVKAELFRDDDIHMNDEGYALWSSYLYETLFRGENFGVAEGIYKTTNGIELRNDRGDQPSVELFGNAPRYAYLHNVYTDKFCFETQMNVSAVLNADAYPKFGVMVHGATEMVKFFVDMTPEMTASRVGVVYQPADGEDDWANAKSTDVNGMRFTGTDTVKLKLVRDGNAYYLYVNDELVLGDKNGFVSEQGAVGIFSFNSVLTATDYTVAVGDDADAAIETAKTDAVALSKISLTTNHFTQTADGIYTLVTDSQDGSKVDDVKMGRTVLKTAYYSISGKLRLTNAENWGQARLLVSSDAHNEHFIALEKTGENSYQIFTMSKANEEGWNDWRLIEHAELNGNRNTIDFEVIVIGDRLYFLIDNQICYTSSRVAMEESTVKFAGYNVATTTVENLAAQVFETEAAAVCYAESKSEKAFVTRFQNRMDALYNEYITQNNCTGKGGTLIFGDSNMDFWSTWEQQSGLCKYVNGYNLGIGGSAVIDWLSVYDRMILPFAADRFVILMGDNDINVWGKSGEETVQNLKLLFEKLHADHPNAEIYYIYTTPSPSAYENGVYKNAKLGALISGAKTLCDSLSYVEGIDLFDRMVTADKQNGNEALFAADRLHMSEDGYKVFSDYLYEKIFRGEFFGKADSYRTSNGVELTLDHGQQPAIQVFGGAPQYAYVHNILTDKFCFETEVNVTAVLNNDGYPKFGLMVNGSTEMVKFFVDMKPNLTATHAGVVYQPAGGGDDWGGSVSTQVPGLSFTGNDTVKLKLVRDGKAYYFYVDDALVLFDEKGFAAENGAVGIFSFNTALTASGYSVLTGDAANSAIQSAQEIVAERTKLGLTCNWFKDNGNGVYSLTTNSNAEHKVDDLTRGGNVLRTAYYSVKGKLTLTNAGDWGQARILVSADAKNEYFIALERTATGKYQIFTMSKANQTGWDKWELILHENDNGTRNSIDYEILVIGNRLYFLIDGTVVYSSTRVSMAQSTVKFTGYNTGTTKVENLSVEIFKTKQEAESYLSGKTA